MSGNRAAKTSHKAVLVQTPYSTNSVQLKDFPLPDLEDNEVLIHNVFVASNPKDWKVHDPSYFEGPSLVEGNDVAGTIHAVGEKVTNFTKGDRVAGFSKMMTHTKYGAYSEYTVVPDHTTFKIADNVPYDAAATLPLAAMTAAIGLFLRLGLPTPEKPTTEKRAVFVNGASSSVGHFAVQLAKLAGLYVIGTAGAAAAVAKEGGADAVIDYRGKSSKEIIDEAKALSSGYTLEHAYDAVTEAGSVQMCCDLLPDSASSKVTVVLPIPDDLKAGKVEVSRTMVGTAHNVDAAFAEKYYNLMAGWLASGQFKGNHVKLMPGGLAGVREGLELLRQGKVSGQKLVYKISDTPGIDKVE